MATVRHLGLFPFCVGTYPPIIFTPDRTEVPVGPLGFYPFTLPVRLCTRMWWTVKSWRISFDFYQYRDISDEYDPGSYTEIPTTTFTFRTDDPNRVSGYYQYQNSGFVSNERDLVCLKEWETTEFSFFKNDIPVTRNFVITGPTASSGSTQLTGSVFFGFNWDFQGDGYTAPFYQQEAGAESGELWTAFRMYFSATQGIGTNWSSTSQGNTTATGTFKLLGQGREITLSRELNSSTTETISNLVIEPDEFWEYDPDDGLGPIYENTTGKQLRAFPDSSATASASVS